jgi:hypothetical protein
MRARFPMLRVLVTTRTRVRLVLGPRTVLAKIADVRRVVDRSDRCPLCDLPHFGNAKCPHDDREADE